MSEASRARAAGQPRVPVRLRHRHRRGDDPEGPLRGDRAADLRQEGRARVAARVAAQGVPALPPAARGGDGAELGAGHVPARSTTRHPYYSAPKQKMKLESLDEVDPELLQTYEKLGIPLLGAEAARRRRGRRRLRQRLGRHHVQGRAREARHRLLLVLRGGAEAPGARAAVPRLGRAVLGQLLRGAELRGLQRRLVRLRPEGRALPDGALDLLPHQRAGDRASSSAR